MTLIGAKFLKYSFGDVPAIPQPHAITTPIINMSTSITSTKIARIFKFTDL